MKNIKNDINSHDFKRIYLLCGNESYLINRCRDMLRDAIVGDSGSDMNYSVYDGNRGFDIKDLAESISAYPFFADHRLVVIENTALSGTFLNDLTDLLEDIPDTTVLVIISETVDKRTKLYKTVQKNGYISEFATPDAQGTAAILGEHFSRRGSKISSTTLMYFIDYVGGDLYNLINESDKLADYTAKRGVITEADINEICTMQIERRIFDIIDNLIQHNRTAAMQIYFDLIALKEAPLGILRFLMSQFNSLLLVRDGMDSRRSDAEIASTAKLAPWLVKKHRMKLQHFSKRQILSALVQCINTEEAIKLGNIAENAGIEILLANLASL